MTKSKFSVNGTVQSVAVFHDQNVALWRKIVEDLKKILKRLHQEREHAAKVEGSASAVQRLQAAALKDAIESGDEGLALLVGRVEAMLALIEGGGQVVPTATPATTPSPVPAAAASPLLEEIARLIGFDRKPPYDLDDLLKTIILRLDDHPLLDSGKYAMNKLRRLLGSYVGLEPDELDGMKTIEIENRFKAWLDELIELLDDVAENLTGRRDASNGEIAEALTKFKGGQIGTPAPPTDGKGDAVPADLIRVISRGKSKKLSAEGAVTMAQGLVADADAMFEVMSIVDPGLKLGREEVVAKVRELVSGSVPSASPVPPEIVEVLLGDKNEPLTPGQAAELIRGIQALVPEKNGGNKHANLRAS